MGAKSNEIAAVRDLLKAFTDLAGAVITIDALHAQAEQAVTSVKGTFRRPGPDPADDLPAQLNRRPLSKTARVDT